MFTEIIAGLFGIGLLTIGYFGLKEKGSRIFGLIALLIGIVVVFGGLLFVAVPAGNVGIQDTFGNVADATLAPGFHIKSPIVTVIPMSVKTQESSELYEILTNEGLKVTVDLTVIHKLDPSKAVNIYKTIGTDYYDVVGRTQIRSVVRNIVAEYDAKAIYSDERTVIADRIFETIEPKLKERGIIVEAVLIRNAELPKTITDAIEAKLEAEQMIAKKEFEVQTEMMEAERKRVEAQGIADSQAIIDRSLTNEYLSWYWIETMGKRVGDNYYIPVGSNGLPQMITV